MIFASRRYERAALLFTIILFAATDFLSAQTFDEKFEHWPLDLKINGTIIASNDLVDTSIADKIFLKASGADKAKILGLFFQKIENDELESLKKIFIGTPAMDFFTIDQKEERIPTAFYDKLQKATGVMLFSSEKLHENARSQISSMKEELQDLLRRSGVIYTNGAVTKMLSRVEITGGKQLSQVTKGLALVPDSIIETNFGKSKDTLRLQSALVSHPRSVGIGAEKNTAIVLSGRKLRVLGEGRATVMLAANEREPFRVQKIAKKSSPRQRPKEYLIDWTQWRREAIDRTLEPFPPAEPQKPYVENGTLLIVGGGGMPKGLMDRFVALAGGVEAARLVYVPCSERDSLSKSQRTVESWEKMGVKHATFIHTKDRNRANSDREFLAPLEKATGIWFGGGRQWNFADSYYGTKAHKLMKEVLHRGGVIGGSSAGASIQARYLARATPIENFDIMAPGYERGGLGFINGVAIDQHFSQRKRQKNMSQLVNRYPQLLGIGIDEATAIIVQKSTAEVVGLGKVHFYDRNLPVFPDRDDFIALPAGSIYDLAARKTVEDAIEEESLEAVSRPE